MRSVSNLLWSVGRTPFGPYSLRADLSFALRDAASRVPLHALASEIMREVRGLATYFGEFGKTVDDVLTASEHLRLCAAPPECPAAPCPTKISKPCTPWTDGSY